MYREDIPYRTTKQFLLEFPSTCLLVSEFIHDDLRNRGNQDGYSFGQ